MTAPSDPRRQMREGPWLDRLFPVQLPDGRVVSVVQLSVLPSNVGVLEGGFSPAANARQREKVLAIAKQRLGGPIVAIEPAVETLLGISPPGHPRERLPWIACMARLTSAPLDPEMVSSELTLVWWQDRLDLPLAQEIARAAAAVDWRRSARDQELC